MGAVTGGNAVGRLVAYVWSGTVSGYATGAITGSGENVGGLVGYVASGTMSGYWDQVSTKQSGSAGGTAASVLPRI